MSKQYALPSELTIYSLSTLHQQWLGWLSKPANGRAKTPRTRAWPIDASAVDEVDAAGVQLLIALWHSLSAQQRSLQLIKPSQPLTNACAALGVSFLLGNSHGEAQ